ncbi:MAG TPA: CBS domain-containing protein [Solirubrobacterales bacterium]|nr:CBS domain-containing protein [Solirubrobacterales bacterium]
MPTAADIMNAVPSVSPDDDARAAIESLADLDIAAIPVVDGDNRVVGIVSESDLVITESEADLHLPHFINIMGGVIFVESLKGFEERLKKGFAARVADLMTPEPVCARTGDDAREVARMIADSHHNHLPVVDDDGRLAGLVTRADALAALVAGD